MPRIESKKTKQHRIIKESVEMGLSGSKIQKLLQDLDLGLRRKTLYEEIRSVKGVSVSKEKQLKSIPKKYRKGKVSKKETVGFGKIGQIYRGSLVISSVPLHSKPFNRRYLGFRLNVFSFNKDVVRDTLKSMKRDFIGMVGDVLRSGQYAREQTLGIESPTGITVNNPNRLNGKWFFAVEEKGRDVNSKEGYI